MGIAGGRQEDDEEEEEESKQSLAILKSTIELKRVLPVGALAVQMVFKHVALSPDAGAKSQLLAATTVTEKALIQSYQILPRVSTWKPVWLTRTVAENCFSVSGAVKRVPLRR